MIIFDSNLDLSR